MNKNLVTDEQKIIRLKEILKPQIEWYLEHLETQGEDYVYDELYDQFNDLTRADTVEIIEILSKHSLLPKKGKE